MELLGFYDEPYQVKVDLPRSGPRRRPVLPVPATTPPPRHTSRVANLWETTELGEEALDWWKPHIIARRKLGRSRVRMLHVITGLLAAILTVGMAWYVVERPSQKAEESADALRADAAALVESLPPLGSLATSLGDANPPDLATSTRRALDAEAAARQVFSGAAGIGDSDPRREGAVGGASMVLDASSRINRLVAFRLTAEDALLAPVLPTRPSIDDLPVIAEEVAAWRADIEASLSGLPANALESTRDRLETWVGEFDAWQAIYLDAIREGDYRVAEAALTSQQEQITSLRRQLRQDLTAAGDEIGREIEEAARVLAPLIGE